jgi:outer membrane protein
VNRIKKIMSIIVAALLAAVPLAAQEPAPPVPPEQTAPGRTLVLSLDDALRIAAGESETVWVAEAGVMQAVGNETATRSGLFPQINGSAGYTRTLRSQFSDISFGAPDDGGGEDALGDLPFGRINQYTLGLTLNQMVFDGGVFARTRAAQARRRSAELGVTSAQAETSLEVTQRYFDALLGDRLVEISESALGQTEEVLRQTEVAREVGAQSEFDLLRARVARDNQIPQVLARRTQRTESYLRLKQLLNVPLGDNLQLTTSVEDLPARFAERADLSADRRVPVIQAEENVRASEAQVAEAQSQRLPAIYFSSRYAPVAYPESGVPDPGDFREDWTVSLNLNVPIFTSGRIRGTVMAARGTLSEARARLQQTREAAELDAQVSLNDLADAEASLRSNTSTVEQARRAYEIAQLRYREGLSSQLELTDSRLLLEQAEVNRALALRDVQVARARLSLIEELPLNLGTSTALILQPVVLQQGPAATTDAGGNSLTGGVGGVPGTNPGGQP